VINFIAQPVHTSQPWLTRKMRRHFLHQASLTGYRQSMPEVRGRTCSSLVVSGISNLNSHRGSISADRTCIAARILDGPCASRFATTAYPPCSSQGWPVLLRLADVRGLTFASINSRKKKKKKKNKVELMALHGRPIKIRSYDEARGGLTSNAWKKILKRLEAAVSNGPCSVPCEHGVLPSPRPLRHSRVWLPIAEPVIARFPPASHTTRSVFRARPWRASRK
jgi:hypothetical protein